MERLIRKPTEFLLFRKIGGILLSIPVEVMLALYALIIGAIVAAISIIILIIMRITRPPDQVRNASISVRFAAFAFDFTIVVLITDIVESLFIGGPSGFVSILYGVQYGSILYLLMTAPILIVIDFASYLFVIVYLLYPWQLLTVGSPLFLIIFSFFYFLILETATGGRTIGKLILRIRSEKADGTQSVTFREAYINALGKSFILLWDLILGIVRRGSNELYREEKQVRLLQQSSGVVVINTRFAGEIRTPNPEDEWLKSKEHEFVEEG